MKSYKRDDCRLCGSTNLEKVLGLTPTPPADSYIPEESLGEQQEVIPLDLYRCESCGHVQMGHVIDAEEVYLNYIYETASTLGLDGHFRECADDVMASFGPEEGGLVIDIGSNDGCLLHCFKEHGMEVLGIDPMPGIAEKASANGVPTLPDFFSESYAKDLKQKYGAASIVTSNNLVADTDNLIEFVKGVRNLMDSKSIFFFETFYLYLQVKNHVWDFTYHEHYSYFTVKPLVGFFKKLGMELIDVKPNLTKGGSMRCTLQLEGGCREIEDSVRGHIELETEMGLHGSNSLEVFRGYQERIDKGKLEYRTLVDALKSEGKKIVGYGASATSTTLIYHYGMQNDFAYLVDDFSAKHNLFSPGAHIPVYESDHIYQDRPDVIVVLAWRYYEKIVQRHQGFLNDGGRIIVPLPEIHEVGI
jgi:hypothetical protein